MSELFAILDRYRTERARGTRVVHLATLVRTSGSTYRRPGARTLFVDGETGPEYEAIGLVSGGCIEADLALRRASSGPRITLHRYDLDGEADELFGLGTGCKGTLDILLERCELSSTNHSLAELSLHYEASRDPGYLRHSLEGDTLGERAHFAHHPSAELGASFFLERLPTRRRVAFFGATPDVLPLLEMAGMLAWERVLIDHRSGLLARVPKALSEHRVGICAEGIDGLEAVARATRVDAAVVMTHHLEADLAVLRGLAKADSLLRYVGLLGPTARRDELRERLTVEERTRLPLFGPAGLDLGGDGPETVALAIVAEIQAVMRKASALPLSLRNGPIHGHAA